jgi:hypothetical protein
MKQLVLSLLVVLISFSGFSQKLNKLGKIVIDELPKMPDHRIEKMNGQFKVVTDSFVFDGNTYNSLPNGFLTCLEVVDDKKDYIKHYNSEGKLLVTILSDRIINLKISKNGNMLAFYNTKNIILLNLQNYKIDTLSGSFIYSFTDAEDFIYYNSENKYIYYKGNRILSEAYPNQFIEYKGEVYVVTKQVIYELNGMNLFPEYVLRGKLFDAKIINDEFYFVDKIEKRKSEAFTLYKTSDFKKIIIIDKLDDLNW